MTSARLLFFKIHAVSVAIPVCLASALLFSTPSYSAPPSADAYIGKTVTDIQVEGNRRIEKEAILNRIETKVGSRISREALSLDIRALFAMGYFDDIDIQGETTPGGARLVYVVKERPVISKVEFEGNEQLSDSDLQEVAKVKEWSILDLNKVREDLNLLQKHYEEKGFYLAKVDFEIRTIRPDEVQLIYRINDYEKVRIKKITFLNNKRFTDEQLKSVLAESREGGFFSFMTGSGNFRENSFKQDLQRLTYWYLEHGYVKFRYEAPVVTVSDDKKYLYISIYVDEGLQYDMGEVDFGGDLLFTRPELREEITLEPGETFSITKRNQDIQRLTEKYQDLGYAFVNVIPRMNINDETRKVDINYEFEKGNLVYFGEINMVGNAKTHDKVIRRELKFREGELYSGTKLRISRENVERLGYFAPGEVVFNTITPKDRPDVLNVEISIKERSTGTVTLGAGYGSAQGFFFTAQVSEINLLGRGQTLSLAAQLSSDRLQKSFNLGFTDPYSFDTEWTTGFDIYYINFPIPFKYTTRKLGFDVRLGRPITDYTYLYLTYKNEGMNVISPARENVDPTEIAADDGTLSSVILSVVRDKRNNRFETTGGNYQSASVEVAGLGGDKNFVKYILNNRFYYRLIGNLVFRTSQEFGHMMGDVLPPAERFYLGGPNNMRGFDYFTLGPSIIRTRTLENGTTEDVREPRGGAVEMFSIFELEYPILREAGLKGVVFYDIGNVFTRWPGFDGLDLRSDVGFGIRWFSPIGPLRFEFGYPLNRRPEEKRSVFQFFIGTPF